MDTRQIERLLWAQSRTRAHFRGCYAADRIPPTPFYPHMLVVNTEPAAMAGAHWVALYVSGPQRVEYYDSLGVWPPHSPRIATYLQQFPIVVHNRHQLQSERSASCGRHAFYFLMERARGHTFDDIVHKLRAAHSPDRLVNAYANYHFGEHIK